MQSRFLVFSSMVTVIFSLSVTAWSQTGTITGYDSDGTPIVQGEPQSVTVNGGAPTQVQTIPSQTNNSLSLQTIGGPVQVVPASNNNGCPEGSSIVFGVGGGSTCLPTQLVQANYGPNASGAAGGTGATAAGSGGTAKASEMADDPCVTAHATAVTSCNSSSTTSNAMNQMQRSAGVTNMGSTGVVSPSAAVQQCMAAKIQAQAAGTGSAVIMHSCLNSADACANACNQQIQKGTTEGGNTYSKAQLTTLQADLKNCNDNKTMVKMGYAVTALTTIMSAWQMEQCDSILSANAQGLCNTGVVNPLCNFSQTGQNGLGLSGAPLNDGANALTDSMPSLPTGTTGGDISGSTYGGNPPGAQQMGQYPTGEGGSGGFGGGGGYPGGGGNPNGGAGGGAQFKTDIGGGLTNGGGGFGTTAVAGNGGGHYGGGNGDADRLDLSCYLPGAHCDPAAMGNRGPASLELVSQGITGPNDLSNFEKVTRMMNRKRTQLLPSTN